MTTKPSCPALLHWEPYGPSFREDPFPTYKTFRDECPIGWVPKYDGFWAISRYQDIFEIARDAETFRSAEGIAIPPFPFEGRALPMESDPPEHDFFRSLLIPEFTPKAIALREPAIRESARNLLKSLPRSGPFDICNAYAKILPTTVVCQLLAIDEADGKFQEWAETIVYDRSNEAAILEAHQNILGYFKNLLPARRSEPGEDLISRLLRAQLQSPSLTDDVILDFCWFLLIAGLDNTAFTIRNMILQLGLNKELRASISANPMLIDDAIEETLRLYSPVWGIARTVSRDITLSDVTIPKGDRVMMLFASADRDEREFPNPDTFVLGRSPNRHMAFGMGRHRCLGSHLARVEIRIAIEELLLSIPDYTIEGSYSWNELGPLVISRS